MVGQLAGQARLFLLLALRTVCSTPGLVIQLFLAANFILRLSGFNGRRSCRPICLPGCLRRPKTPLTVQLLLFPDFPGQRQPGILATASGPHIFQHAAAGIFNASRHEKPGFADCALAGELHLGLLAPGLALRLEFFGTLHAFLPVDQLFLRRPTFCKHPLSGKKAGKQEGR